MGTTLTGTKPKDTYDSLIKVEDNGPISGTAKYLSDGLGNNLPIAVSTTNVGIGTSAPAAKLQTQQTSAGSGVVGMLLQNVGSAANTAVSLDFAPHENTTSPTTLARINAVRTAESAAPTDIVFSSFNVTLQERLRILSSGGITFNGDTAAANALDDYEEGTWTPTMAFGGGSTGVTYFDRQGNYTKIGRQVTCTIYLALTAKGSSTGVATITGLPFTSSNLNRGMASGCSFRFDNVTYSGQFQMAVDQNSTVIDFFQTTELGADSQLTNTNFNNSSEFQITVTYFV